MSENNNNHNNNNRGTMLAKSVQKHAGRAKEKFLQNLGKVDRTADEIFDDHLNNFNRQQGNATKFQKEFNNYIRCIRAAQLASKSLMDAINEIYEPQWTGFEALQEQIIASENLWADFAHKLGDQVLIPLNTYNGQFPEMKKKIEKRNRKLIDYDGQRHSFQNLQANANKRKDDAKLTKGREQLEEARRTYEILNTELHDELPALYDSRILFLVTNLQTLFATEQVFHHETAKIYSELEAIVDKLATESQRGSNTLLKQSNKFLTTNTLKSTSPVQTPNKQLNNSGGGGGGSYQNQISTNGGGSSLANSQISANSSTSSPEEESPTVLHNSTIIAAAAAAAAEEAVTTTITPAIATTLSITSITTPNSSIVETPSNNNESNNAAESETETEKEKENNGAASSSNAHSKTNTDAPSPSPSPAQLQTPPKSATAAAAAATTEAAGAAAINETATNEQRKVPKTLKETTQTAATTQTTAAAAAAILAKAAALSYRGDSTLNGNNDNNAEQRQQQQSTATATATEQNQQHVASNGNDAAAATKLGNENVCANSGTNDNNKVAPPTRKKPIGKNPFEDDDDDDDNDDVDVDVGAVVVVQAAAATVALKSKRNYENARDANTADLPPGVLYRVKATYSYAKEDVDELSFEIGEIIRVIEYDDPEDQEEGWLMGQKEGTNEKGLFPANFTCPI